MFAPARGVENPIVRRAVDLCDQAGMKVIYHEDAVEVWFSPGEKRFYTTWNQFLTDTEMLFGARLQEAPESAAPARATFGNRAAPMAEAVADAVAEAVYQNSADSGEAAQAEIKRLRAEVRLLERAIKVVGMQSEEWKRESESARQELATARVEMANMVEARLALSSHGPDRYKMVRQIVVKRLHPDIAGTADEKIYRERLFKSIWQDIEALDRKQ